MIRKGFILAALYASVALPSAALAHHSVAFTFDVTRKATIVGTVTRVWFKNPHIRYYISVPDENGVEQQWDTHGHNPVWLTRTGWTKDTIKVGDKITMTGDPTRDDRPLLFIRSVTLENGRVLTNAPGAKNQVLSQASHEKN